MKIDVDVLSQVGAVTREVLSRDHNGRPARVIVATRTYDTAAEDVWDAITSAERIPRWFLPISGDLRQGGHYQLEGNAGGEITSCEPTRHLALTWGMGGEDSWVDVRLEERDGKTTLVLEHTAYVGDDLWQEYGPGAVGVGWDLCILGLALHLSTGAAIDPADAATWPMSDQGKDYVRRTSDEWARASVASGADAAAAGAAAARTTAFYTGETAPAS